MVAIAISVAIRGTRTSLQVQVTERKERKSNVLARHLENGLAQMMAGFWDGYPGTSRAP